MDDLYGCMCEGALNFTGCIIVLLKQNPGHNLEFSCGGHSKIGQSPYFADIGPGLCHCMLD